MASTAAQNYIGLDTLLNCCYSMIGVVSGFALTRIAVRITRPKALAAEDGLVVLAYLSFLVMTILYIKIAPTIYRVNDVVNGITPPYASLEADALGEIKVFFANTMLFWCSLWFVKGSLLALYRKLLSANQAYRRIWWTVVVFCVVTFIGAIISNLTSCSSLTAWFTVGGCATPRDSRAQIISLYYAFAVDVTTDLMVMALPIALIWDLKLAPLKKAGIITLFCVGWIAIATAIVRVVSIGVRAGTSTPSSTWLVFWGTIESGMAVIIGTAPGLYSSARKVHTTRKESRYAGYNGGYLRHTGDAALQSPLPAKSLSSNIRSTSSIDDDEEGFVPQSMHRKSGPKAAMSFSRPTYLQPATRLNHLRSDEGMEMRPRDDGSSPRILVTRQFAVRNEGMRSFDA